MKTIYNFCVSFLFATFMLPVGCAQASALSNDIAKCSSISDSLQRLVCYDNTVIKHHLDNTPEYIQPDSAFLDSLLVVKPWVEEYTLTVRNFAKLISQARLDSGERVIVHGWTRAEQDYVLNITMRTPLKLRFSPRNATDKPAMSLLRNVIINGEPTDAGQFIMVIAAMVPDKKNSGSGKDSEPRQFPSSERK